MSEDTGDRPYYQGKVECIEAIEAIIESQDLPAVEGYLVATMLKYLWRYNCKHDNPLEDLIKVRWFLSRLIKRVEERQVGDDALGEDRRPEGMAASVVAASPPSPAPAAPQAEPTTEAR